jgi:hypothetical protein
MNDWLSRLMSAATGSPSQRQLIELAGLLDVSTGELSSIFTDARLSYRPFTVRKADGGKRQIFAPSSPLKLLQRRLLHRYLAEQPIHEAATAFRPGGSIADHARRHLGQALVLTVDLADFFPSTSTRRVRRWFREQGWRDMALDILARLCVYRGGLPQGAPTSPALSNLLNRPLDQQLSQLAATCGGRYSRYCDDMAFSWGGDVEPPAFRLQVADAVQAFGYRIQADKGWRLQRGSQSPEITGLVLDGRRLRLSSSIVERLRRARSRWQAGDHAAWQQLQGYLGLSGMLKSKRRVRPRW